MATRYTRSAVKHDAIQQTDELSEVSTSTQWRDKYLPLVCGDVHTSRMFLSKWNVPTPKPGSRSNGATLSSFPSSFLRRVLRARSKWISHPFRQCQTDETCIVHRHAHARAIDFRRLSCTSGSTTYDLHSRGRALPRRGYEDITTGKRSSENQMYCSPATTTKRTA